GPGGGVSGLRPRLGEGPALEGPAVREPLPAPGHDPHPDGERVGHGELLHLAPVDADRRVGRPGDVGLELLVTPGEADDGVGHLEEIAHAAVPPTVRAFTRRVGTPSPTGTPWPSLPQVPGLPIEKSLPTASM